jgi:DNA ligase-1
MLSATCEDINKLAYPLIASPKVDGIRCIIFDGTAYSRKMEPLPNRHLQKWAASIPDGLDGELIVGSITDPASWNETQSGIMSEDDEPDFSFFIFDRYEGDPHGNATNASYEVRLSNLTAYEKLPRVRVLPHVIVKSEVILQKYVQNNLSLGYEGTMVRDPAGAYKQGRSTLKESGLLKIKPWFDSEAVVLSVVERKHNENEATKDALGYTKRSSHKGNKVGTNTLGAFVCRDVKTGEEFRIGTGLTDEQRDALWTKREDLIGAEVSYVYRSLTTDNKPRHPSFKGLRYD